MNTEIQPHMQHEPVELPGHGDVSKKETASVFVNYRDNAGKQNKIFHPQIMGERAASASTIRPDAVVTATLPDKTVSTNFGEYLAMIGSNYQEYEYGIRHERLPNQDLLLNIHMRSLKRRLENATTQEKRAAVSKDSEIREETQKGVEGFVVKMVNDVGYGQAIEADPQSDHSDKIDFFISINPAEDLEDEEGEPVYFGIQHTTLTPHNEEKMVAIEEKKGQIVAKPETYIPEHTEFGLVTRVFVHEERERYFPGGGELSHAYTLNSLRRAGGKPPKTWQAFLYDGRGKRNQMTEQQAKYEAVQRVYNLYKHIGTELGRYIATETPDHQLDLLKKKTLISRLLHKIREENKIY